MISTNDQSGLVSSPPANQTEGRAGLEMGGPFRLRKSVAPQFSSPTWSQCGGWLRFSFAPSSRGALGFGVSIGPDRTMLNRFSDTQIESFLAGSFPTSPSPNLPVSAQRIQIGRAHV